MHKNYKRGKQVIISLDGTGVPDEKAIEIYKSKSKRKCCCFIIGLFISIVICVVEILFGKLTNVSKGILIFLLIIGVIISTKQLIIELIELSKDVYETKYILPFDKCCCEKSSCNVCIAILINYILKCFGDKNVEEDGLYNSVEVRKPNMEVVRYGEE